MGKNLTTEKEEQNSFINELERNRELLEELRDKARIADLIVILEEYFGNDTSNYHIMLSEETVDELQKEIEELKGKVYYHVIDDNFTITNGAEHNTNDHVDILMNNLIKKHHVESTKESQ